MPGSTDNWGSVAELVTALGTERFSPLLHQYLERGICASVLFAYAIRADARDADLLLDGSAGTNRQQEHRDLMREYAQSGFSQDPLIRAQQQAPLSSPFVRVRHASEVSDPDFRYRYFEKMGTPEELSIVGGQGSTELLYIGFSGNHFSAAETRYAEEQAPLVLALLQKDRQMRAQSGSNAAPLSDRNAALRAALTSNPARLTSREVEVCTQIIRGLSAEGIALELNISRHTVITHRKRAYAKLNISSQGELFAKIYRVAYANRAT